MDFYCDKCGFHARFGRGQAPYNGKCQVCGVGQMHQGECAHGFRVVQNAIQAFMPDGQAVAAPGPPTVVPGEQYLDYLDYFAGELGDAYKKFIQTETVYMGRFNKILLPEPRRFAWLSPYTGNKHNQRYFTQAALAK